MIQSAQQTEHIVIIDDHQYIRATLASTLFASCAMNDRDVRIINVHDVVGRRSDATIAVPLAAPGIVIGIADNARHALTFLDPALVHRATILCDIETPNDTQVGIFGLLDHLAATGIAVNLIFISLNAQNINWVRKLTVQRKAYFVTKDSSAWARLPHALIQNLSTVEYRRIVRDDYDAPFLHDVALPPLRPQPPLFVPRPSLLSRLLGWLHVAWVKP